MTTAPASGAHRRVARRLTGAAARLFIIVLIGVVLCAALVRYSPGFESEESDLDSRLSGGTAAALHGHDIAKTNFLRFLGIYIAGIARGDLGTSRVFNVPVRDLLRERAGPTAALMASGLALAWLAATALAWIAVWKRNPALRLGAQAVAGIALAVPPAIIAVEFFAIRAPLSAAMAIAIMPRLFGTLRELLESAWRSPAVVCARARGISGFRLALHYVAGSIAPELTALMGISVVLAFGAAIPIEALCDVPGLGQLAWRAALGRDLPLLCALAIAVTFSVALAQAAAELFDFSPSEGRA